MLGGFIFSPGCLGVNIIGKCVQPPTEDVRHNIIGHQYHTARGGWREWGWNRFCWKRKLNESACSIKSLTYKSNSSRWCPKFPCPVCKQRKQAANSEQILFINRENKLSKKNYVSYFIPKEIEEKKGFSLDKD